MRLVALEKGRRFIELFLRPVVRLSVPREKSARETSTQLAIQDSAKRRKARDESQGERGDEARVSMNKDFAHRLHCKFPRQ